MTVKNIIFDMGNVLIDYCPERYTTAFLHCQPGAPDCQLVTKILFGEKTWLDLDKGIITESAALKIMLSKLPERLKAPAKALFYGWQSYILPIKNTNELAVQLHKAGYKIYILSNTGVRLHTYGFRIPAFTVADGVIYSADVQQVKPNKDIYITLLSKYDLKPEECFFTDDNPENIKTAAELGLYTHLFKKDNFCALQEKLRSDGVMWE